MLIGRGTYGRPWFPGQVQHYLSTGTVLADPDLETQRDTVIEHYRDILSHYGVHAGVKIARKHIGWYSKGLRDAAEFRAKVNQMTEPTDVEAAIIDFYAANLDRLAA